MLKTTKVCFTCQQSKNVSEFGKQKASKDGFYPNCKICTRQLDINAGRTKSGFISRLYKNQKKNATSRGHDVQTYTKIELTEWLNSNALWNPLFKQWEDSDYDTELKPSADRIDDTLSYTLDNIQLMTWNENRSKAHRDMKSGKLHRDVNKAIVQLTKDGLYIAEYHSIMEASRKTGVSDSSICACAKGKQRYSHAGGFTWKYKGDKDGSNN